MAADYTPLLQVMKQSAKETNNALCPVQVCYGKVISLDPFKIQVDQKITLKKPQLIFTKGVTDYEITYSIPPNTERYKRKIHNALKVGEEVILLRQQGGQKYIILDRTVKE
jgi:predicted nucleotide-binding protein (sugar kinase/HSP70/actin superfamily)